MLRVDQVLHQRYRVVRELGHGGMGAVFEAIVERFGEPIALKEVVLASPNASQKELVARAFEREAKALAKAHHEAIPYVRDYFSEADRQFLVMELVPGDDLAELLAKRRSPFPLADCLRWLDQLLDALDYLHTLERPIFHRDIKPQNLKLNSRGKIKLLDFGIAKSAESAAATLSNQTFVGATLEYSPVEQILRAIDPTFREYILLKHRETAEEILAQATDARCDIYALGATFYHLMTDRPPPDAVKRTLEIWEGRADPLTAPSEVDPSIPPRISACIQRAMAVRREDRFDTASAMRAALMRAVADNKPLASSVYNESWEAEQVRLRSAEEAHQRELELMRAKTAVLSANDLAQPPGKAEDTPDIQDLPTERLVNPPSNAGAISNVPASQFLKTIPSRSTEVTENFPDSGTTAAQARKTENVHDPDAILQPRNSSAALWILAAVLAVFGLGAIGTAMFMLSPGSVGTATTNVNSSTTPTPVFDTPTPATPTPEITPSPQIDNRPVVQPTATPRTTQAQTPAPTPVQNPERTPRPTPAATPARTPRPQKTPDPNCIYNNTCK
jgi:serine/threonine protein kinase